MGIARFGRTSGVIYLLELAFTAAALLWTVLSSEPGIGPFLIAMLPWGIKVAEGHLSWRATRFDVAIIVFVLTGFVGYLAGYDRISRWSFLWLIALAIVLYYVISRRSPRELWIVLNGWMLASGALAAYFLFSHDWEAQPAEFQWLQTIGLKWARLRPDLGLETFEPNIVGGVLAVLSPLILAVLVRGVLRGQRKLTLVHLLSLLVTLIGILLSSSRGAWLALLVGVLVGVVLVGRALIFPRAGRGTFGRWAALMTILGLIIGLWVLTLQGDRIPTQLDEIVPGAPSAQSRVDLTRDTFRLLQDYPFTGSGLTSFPGQYSRYIRFVSNYYYGYAHNLYLDIALAQGPFASVALLVMQVGAIWLLVDLPTGSRGKPGEGVLLRAAVVSGLVVTMVHGLIDDPLYVSRGIVLLFFFPAAAVAIHGGQRVYAPAGTSGLMGTPAGWKWRSGVLIGISGLAIILVLIGDFSLKSIRSAFISNQASISLSRRELANFPKGIVFEIRDLAGDRIQRERLETALELDGENRTAIHRLGLIAIRKGDYTAAAARLERASGLDPDHPGIAKALGYTYVWLGEFERAREVLNDFPEVRVELEGYAHWWSSLNQPGLASNARRMAALLAD